MPKDAFDLEDPFELVGVEIPSGEEGMEEMATTFVEEFIRGGFSDAEIVRIFEDPFYIGPHQVWREKGGAAVIELIGKVRSLWGPPLVR